MKHLLRSFPYLLLLAIFLYGTTGISFKIHECKSSNTKEVFLFAGIFNHHSSCGCSEEDLQKAQENQSLQFNDPDCCKTTRLYFKAPFLGFPVINNQNSVDLPNILLPGFLTFLQESVEPEMPCFIPIQDHAPPPLSGRLLVQTIHQIKIPFPFSLI